MSRQPVAGDDAALLSSTTRWQAAGGAIALLLVIAFPLYRAVDGARRDESLAARQAALVRKGQDIWALSCVECHGITGQGVDAPALNSKEFLTTVSDEQIHQLTAVGIPGTEMPAWWNEVGGPFTDEEIAAVVAYIRSWEETAPSRPDWRTPEGAPTGSEGAGASQP